MAAIFGAYIATMLIHIAIAKTVADDTPVLLTATYSGFCGWVGLMIMVYFVDKAWVSWAILLGLCAVSSLFIFLQ